MPPKAVLIEPLVGRKIRLNGLSSRKELNGYEGKCLEYRSDEQRFVVEIQQGTEIKRCMVPLSCVSAVDDTTPSLLSRLKLQEDGRTVELGRTLLEVNLIPIFMERCRVEIEKKTDSARRFHLAGCAACGQRSQTMVICAGCSLCQWCDNEVCQRHSVEAGHGVLCQQIRVFRQIVDNPGIRHASKVFHSKEHWLGYNMGLQVAERLAKETRLDNATTKTLETLCGCVVLWPASAEIATCAPGAKISFLGDEVTEFQFCAAGLRTPYVPGKLTFCATSHKAAFKALSKKDLKEKHELPCGQDPMAGKGEGIQEDVSHAPIKASLKDLSTRDMQQSLCASGCNSRQDGFMGGAKTILSDVFYSYCLKRVCNAADLPGSIKHCPMCGLCRNYIYSHCTRCNLCSYGSACQIMPCMHCHDLMLMHDGVVFVPINNGQCPADPSVGMNQFLNCKCRNGILLWNDASPSTRQPLVSPVSVKKENTGGPSPSDPMGLSDRKVSAVFVASMDATWAEAQSSTLKRVELIDNLLSYMKIKSDGYIFDIKGLAEKLDPRLSSTSAPLYIADLQDMANGGSKINESLLLKFEAQRQNSRSSGESLQAWLITERDKEAAVAKSEFETTRASGAPVHKTQYKEVLADRCDFCDTKATAFKALMICARCKTARYCDAACQKSAWPKHKLGCKKNQQG